MKASIKFREDQKPLLKAKLPLNILGLPFLAGGHAGDHKDLRLDLITAFESGPSLRASYRPNDPTNPFSLSLRIGVSSFGSPIAAPLSMTTEFNFGANPVSNPKFLVLFKPQIGDFSFRKVSASMPKVMASPVDSDPSAIWVEKVTGTKPDLRWSIGDALAGAEVTARSVMPVTRSAAVSFKWGVRVPAELKSAFAEDGSRGGFFSLKKVPLLVMNKISIEHVAGGKRSEKKVTDVGDVAEVMKQLEAIRVENGSLKKAVEELREWGPAAGGADVSRVGMKKAVEGSGWNAASAAVTEEAGK